MTYVPLSAYLNNGCYSTATPEPERATLPSPTVDELTSRGRQTKAMCIARLDHLVLSALSDAISSKHPDSAGVGATGRRKLRRVEALYLKVADRLHSRILKNLRLAGIHDLRVVRTFNYPSVVNATLVAIEQVFGRRMLDKLAELA